MTKKYRQACYVIIEKHGRSIHENKAETDWQGCTVGEKSWALEKEESVEVKTLVREERTKELGNFVEKFPHDIVSWLGGGWL
jgi:hypothetical protein